MTATEIEKIAHNIFENTKVQNPAVRADEIAEFYCGLEFEWLNLKNDSSEGTILAAISFRDKKIYLNESQEEELKENPGRRNFTIAHELGHWFLHRDFAQDELPGFDGKFLLCRGMNKLGNNRERQANLFATYLLMPENFVREEFGKITQPFNWSHLQAMAEKFCVSKQAMEIRLTSELKLVYKDSFGNYYRSKTEAMEAAGQLKLF